MIILVSFQTKILAFESSYKVITRFEDAHIDYVSSIIEYKIFKSKCKGNKVSKRKTNWKCKTSSDGLQKKCIARFSCLETLFPNEKSDKKKELISRVKKYRNKKGNGKLRVKIGVIKEKEVVQKLKKNIEDSNWDQNRDCKNGFCFASFQFAGLRVSDESGSALITANFSWAPKYTLNQNWSLFAKAGGHLLSSSSVTSFLVFDTGLYAEYRLDQLAFELGYGRQVWNDTSGDVLGYISFGASFYLKEEALYIIDKFFMSYTSISSERGVSSINIGAGIEF